MDRLRNYGRCAALTAGFFFCMAISAYALDVTLQWDANTEPDLAGYKIYYRAESSGGGVLGNYDGTGAYEGDSPIEMTLAQDENSDPNTVEFTVTGLPNGQTFFLVVTAYDNEDPSNESGPSNEVDTGSASPDTTPPVISNVQVSSTTENSAVIVWTTDEPSDSTVQCGTSSSTWGNYPFSEHDATLVTGHSVLLTDLAAGTSYCFRVGSTDGSENGPTISDESTFTTLAAADYYVESVPLDLQSSTPESEDVLLTLHNIPFGTTAIELVMTVYDADFSEEGRLYINGQGPISLFGDEGLGANDSISVIIAPIVTEIAWYQLGQNTLTFWHDSTAGFVIEEISLNFVTQDHDNISPKGLRIDSRLSRY